MQEGPKLLIEWEPRGQSFVQSFRPALSRSGRRLQIELHRQRRPMRPIVLSFLLHAAILIAIISLPAEEALRTINFVEPIAFEPERYEIVYVPARSLPAMTDAGGTASGTTGAAGGASLETPEQIIRIVRGNPVTPHVVDVPKLNLPRTEVPANLLVSSAPTPSVPANAIQHDRIMTVQAFAATSAVAPTPQIVRERVTAIPALPITPVPPPVSTSAQSLAGSKLELPPPVVPPPDAKHEDAATLAAIRRGVPPPDIKVVDVGSVSPPAQRDTSVVMSSQPGTAIGKPNSESPGAIAMSPTGTGKAGVGEGLGAGAARGSASGSGTTGGLTGASINGAGRGDGNASGGISPGMGPGGSGNGVIASAIPGVTISGGKVMIPSFGATSAVKAGTSARMPKDERNVRPVTIVSTATAGGAVSARGLLKGAKVYTIYIDTTAGLAFLQFSERASGPAERDLTAPEPLMSMVPADLRSARVLLAGMMDRNGSLRDLRVVDAVSQEVARHLIEAVQRWHFRPALKGDDPVEVDAIFGLNVDTR